MGARQKTPKRKHLKPWDKPTWQKERKKGRKPPKFDIKKWEPLEAQISPGQYYYAWEKWQAAGYKVAWDDAVIDIIQHDPEEAIQETIDFSPRITMWQYLNDYYGKEADASQNGGTTNTQNETNNG